MSNNVTWILRGLIKADQQSSFNTLMSEMVAAAQKEEGTLIYEWTLAEDGTSLEVYERYRDEAAVKTHFFTWNHFAPRFKDLVNIERITVYSKLSPEMKAAFDGAEFMMPVGGFAR